MAERNDPNFIPQPLFRRLYGYDNAETNDYAANPAAQAAMIARIQRLDRFDDNSNAPFPCGCDPRGANQRRCHLNTCPTRNANLECGLACQRDNEEQPCMNREISNENFVETFDIRAHREGNLGTGLFAIDDIPKDTYIGELHGTLGIGNDLPNRFCFPIGETFQQRGELTLYLDLEQYGNEMRYLNTSCLTNAEIVTKGIGTEMHAAIRTTKKIRRNSEILLRYPDLMLNNMEHECNRRQCRIRTYLRQRAEQQAAVAAAEDGQAAAAAPAPRRRRQARRIREDLLDARANPIYFEYPGLGPIQGVGMFRPRARQTVPPQVRRLEILDEEVQAQEANDNEVNGNEAAGDQDPVNE